MFYAKILVIGETKAEIMSIIGHLYNLRRRQFANTSKDLPEYVVAKGNGEGKFFIKEDPTHDFDIPLSEHIENMD
jgi:hypothetical protein